MAEIGECEDCKFWGRRRRTGLEPSHQKNEKGWCRRFAPKESTQLDHAKWPETWDKDWCGEFEAQVTEDAE